GIAVTFVDWEDLARWTHIDKELQFGQPEPTETYSSSEHLFSDLNIAQGTKGRIRASQKVDDKKPATRSGSQNSGKKPHHKKESEPHHGRVPHEGKSEHKVPPRNRTRNRTRGGQS
ncbi:MAG: ATP-dependent helicase, partial [Actinomycetota bacterium]